MTKEELLTKILDNYQSCYDIERCVGEGPLAATADYHEHQAGFMLIRKAEMWSADRHEYSFFYVVPELTDEIFAECMEKTRALGEAKVKPEEGHMCSNVVAVFLCDRAKESAIGKLKKYRYTKSFSFSFKGWMEVHTAAVVLEDDVAVSNAAGRGSREYLNMLLHPVKKKKKNSIFKFMLE